VPKFARVVAPSEAVKSGNFSDPFRPRYAMDVQLLGADGNPDQNTSVYSAVPMLVPTAGNDSGIFLFPPEGTMVEVGFTAGGRISPLSARPYQTEPACRIFSLASSCSSSGRKYLNG